MLQSVQREISSILHPSWLSPTAPTAVYRGAARFLDAQEQRRVGRIQWEDLVAYARACGGAGGVFSIASLMVATGTDLKQ